MPLWATTKTATTDTKPMKKILTSSSLLLVGAFLIASSNPPVTSYEHCSVSSTADAVNAIGLSTSGGSLRQKIDAYNQNRPASLGGRCTFNIFFEFSRGTIVLSRPLFLAKHLHDDLPEASREHLRGVFIDGYGTGGESELLDVTIDARHVTETPGQCAFMIEDGFTAKHKIKGLTLLVQNEDQAICDDEGVDLYHAMSPNCDGGRAGQAFEDGCDFPDVTLLTPPPPLAPPSPSDSDHDGVEDSQDRCPRTSRKFSVNARGCPDPDGDGIDEADDACPQERGPAKRRGCPTPAPLPPPMMDASGMASGGHSGSGGLMASGGSGGLPGSGGMGGSGGNGSGGQLGSGGMGGRPTSGGSSGISGSGGSAGSAGSSPSRNDRVPDPFGCQLVLPSF